MDDEGDLLYNLACECETLFDTRAATLRAQAPPLADLLAEYQQRFAIWAAHLGVFARKSQSLDTRLRNHADIQDLVARLLDILRRSLDQLVPVIETTETHGISRVDEGTPRDATLSTVDTTLTRLNRLGVTIRQSSRGRIDVKIQRFAASFDIGPFAAVSQVVVQQFYPSAHRSLQQHLAKTMVDRYASMMFTKYRKEKLQSRRPGTPRGFMPTIDERREVDLGAHPPGLTESGVSQDMLSRALGHAGLTGRSSATARSDLSTVNSKQLRQALLRTNNFQLPTERRHGTSSVQVGQGNYPRLPPQKESNFFTCEWCSKIIENQDMNDSDWRRHIDEDLQPYVCIYDSCSERHPAFPSFALWLAHMKEHDRRWHQRVFPTSSWICAVCDDNPDTHASPESLHGHLVQAHGDMFPAPQLPAIARQSKVERLRPWNECLLCCFTVEEAEPPPKSRKDQPVNETSNKHSRTSFAMKHPRADRDVDQDSDESNDSPDVAALKLTSDNVETMARHVAAHLQVLMLLTIRLAHIYDDHGQDTQDDANSASVDIGDSDDVFTKSARTPITDPVPTEDVDMPDAHGEGLEIADIPEDDLAIPDVGNAMGHCIFCNQDEEHDPGEEFEPFLTCGKCAENNAHQQCARENKALLPEDDPKHWRCLKCADNPDSDVVEGRITSELQAPLRAPDETDGDSRLPPSSLPTKAAILAEDSYEDADGRYQNVAQSAMLIEDVTPDFIGFQQHLLKMNPQLGAANHQYLVDRIAQHQIERYERLLNLRVKHHQAVAAGNCSSGSMCIALGGRAILLRAAMDDLDMDSDGNISSLGRPVYPESFPPDIPLPPTSSLPAEVECQLCFSTVEVTNLSGWINHVHEDTQPFTCTWEGCKFTGMFKWEETWVRHENEAHRRLEWWTCDVDDCGHVCSWRDDFFAHIVREHTEPKAKTMSAVKVAESINSDPMAKVNQCHHKTTKVPQAEPCRFCGKTFSSWETLTDHLARHMEHISLQVLKVVAREVRDKDTITDRIGEPSPNGPPNPESFLEPIPGPSTPPGLFSPGTSPSPLSSPDLDLGDYPDPFANADDDLDRFVILGNDPEPRQRS